MNARGCKPGSDAKKNLPGNGFKCVWIPLIVDEMAKDEG